MGNWKTNKYTPVSVDGVWRDNTTRALQYGLGNVQVDGVLGPATKRAVQVLIGVTPDGVWGANTYRRLQAYIGLNPQQQDGVFGPHSTEVFQAALNAGTLGAPARAVAPPLRPPTPAPAPKPTPKPTPAPTPKPVPAPPGVHGRASIRISQVSFGRYGGGGNVASWTTAALQHIGWPVTQAWIRGYETLCARESSGRANAVNTTDSNANGPTVGDGHPLNCSRGPAQCIPGTFAAYHAAGTSNDIYDPVANIAASILYCAARYGVRSDGSNLAARVQQADPSRPPRGY